MKSHCGALMNTHTHIHPTLHSPEVSSDSRQTELLESHFGTHWGFNQILTIIMADPTPNLLTQEAAQLKHVSIADLTVCTASR